MIARPAPEPRRVVVGIGELAVSIDERVVLTTYALGSCVAIIVHDPVRRIGGLIHYMLPDSRALPERARDTPAMFADTGVPTLFHRMYGAGAKKTDLVVKIAGGGHLLEVAVEIDVGARNLEAAERLFERSGVRVAARDVGGTVSRTVELHVGTGDVLVRSQRKERRL